jgi:Domain of unknown function (DUF5667)
MMSMADARRQAAEFAAAADGHATATLDAETQAFLSIVAQLRALDAPVPSPTFTATLRSQLLAAASAVLVAAPVERPPAPPAQPPKPRRRRILSVAASLCILAGSGMGVAAASQSALPGDVLYPVKRGIEDVGVSVASVPAARGHEYIDSASTRLSEVQALAITRADDPSTAALIAATLADFDGEAKNGSRDLIAAYHQDSSDVYIVDLRTFASDSAQKLRVLGTTVPADARDDVLGAARTIVAIDSAASTACPWCGSFQPITMSGDFAALQQGVTGALVPLAPVETGVSGRRFPGVTSPTLLAPRGQAVGQDLLTAPPLLLPPVAAPGELPSPQAGNPAQQVSPTVTTSALPTSPLITTSLSPSTTVPATTVSTTTLPPTTPITTTLPTTTIPTTTLPTTTIPTTTLPTTTLPTTTLPTTTLPSSEPTTTLPTDTTLPTLTETPPVPSSTVALPAGTVTSP